MSKFNEREKDFRNGAIVYQVLVDRFAPSANLKKKLPLYTYPKTLLDWDQIPKAGHFMSDVKYWSHELVYFGGDLQSVKSKLPYLDSLNIDVLYLNPICESLSNHKYDASDYLKISPEYGTMEDLKSLSDELHKSGKKIMLDGVFNHVGVHSPLFEEAQNPLSKKRDWFYFGNQYPQGVRLWADARSLPELNLENEEVKDYIYRLPNSVIRSYLRLGIDGWRLDVAFDIGYEVLRDLTDHAHLEKRGSMVVGETWNYPPKWLKAMDGVMNFTLREMIFDGVENRYSANRFNRLMERMVEDSGIEGILKSWVLLDNHDTIRLNHRLPSVIDQHLAQVLQFTLPGSPNLYYGSELGMTGAGDPENRAPMRWDLVKDDNSVLQWTKSLIELHQSHRALKIGDYKAVDSDKLIAFERLTDLVDETILVFVNPSDETVDDIALVRDSSLMNYSQFEVLLGEKVEVMMIAGFMHISLPPKSFAVLTPKTKPTKSYTPYKRV